MELRELLGAIARSYDRELGQQASAAKLLRDAGNVIGRYIPRGYIIKGSSGQSTPAFVPWIAVFDPDETTSAMHGTYVVYLFAADMRTIFLTLLQGSEDLRKELKAQASESLSRQAAAIRRHLDLELIEGLEDHVSLLAPPRVQRPRYYEAGTIVAKHYEAERLPADTDLREDLIRFVHLCHHAIDSRRQLTLAEPELIATRECHQPPLVTGEFKPKDNSDYQQIINAKTITKGRRHETLLREFNEHLCAHGFTTAAPHPRDLVASRGKDEWLVEAKVLQHGNGIRATREALGQLLWYRHCHYMDPRSVGLIALFNEPVGGVCVEVLQAIDVECVWPADDGWFGTPGAVSAGFCDEPPKAPALV